MYQTPRQVCFVYHSFPHVLLLDKTHAQMQDLAWRGLMQNRNCTRPYLKPRLGTVRVLGLLSLKDQRQ